MTAKTFARILWGFYLAPLTLALACFVGLVITGSGTCLASGLMACLAAWFVTAPLDLARYTAQVEARSAS